MKEPCVCVIDDDQAVRQSTAALLQAKHFVVHGFESAAAFLDAPEVPPTGCILLDYRMPDIDGLTALPLITERCPTLSVVMITAHGDVDVAVKALKSGAVDLLEKPWETQTLLDALDRALGVSRLRAAAEAERQDALSRLARLTPRERDVFEELVTGAPNKVIAYRLGLSTRTVEFHRARLLEKTEASSVAELVVLKTRSEAP